MFYNNHKQVPCVLVTALGHCAKMQYFWKKPVEHHLCLNVVYFTRVRQKLPKSLGIWILQVLNALCGFFKRT